jgi:lipopolysaccharide export system permease protein
MRPLKKIDYLMIKELIPLLIVGVLTFGVLMASLVLLKQALKYYTEYHLPFMSVVVFFVYGMPQVLAYTFPMAILLASLLTFGRMSSGGEITAIRAGGINFFRILLPVLVVAFFLTCCTFLLNELVAPRASLTAVKYITSSMTEVGISLSRNNISKLDKSGKWLFGAEGSQGNDFYQVWLIDYRYRPDISLYVAEKASWGFNTWIFQNVQVYSFDLKNEEKKYFIGEFDTLSIDLNRVPAELMEEGRNPDEFSLKELRNYIADERVKGDKSLREMKKLEATYFLKIATPFSCFLFPFIAAPLGMNPQRGSSTVGMGYSMILVFIYYLLTQLSINVAQNNYLLPIVAAWLPNLILLVVGIYLNGQFLWKAGR